MPPIISDIERPSKSRDSPSSSLNPHFLKALDSKVSGNPSDSVGPVQPFSYTSVEAHHKLKEDQAQAQKDKTVIQSEQKSVTIPEPIDRDTGPLTLSQTVDQNSEAADTTIDPASSPTFAICAVAVSVLAFILVSLFSWKYFTRRRRVVHLRSRSSDSVPVHISPFDECAPEKCFGSVKLGSLRRAVTNPFRGVKRQSSEPYKISSSHGQDKEGFGVNMWENGVKLGLSEVELSQILSSPPSDHPMLSPGDSATTQSTLPTDSWDQYMSILKHEEHLHFEDITPVHPVKHTNAEISYHRNHPSLLSHYFYSTIGGLNRVEPYNGPPTTKKAPESLKSNQDYEMSGLGYTPAVSIFRDKASSKNAFSHKNKSTLSLSKRITPSQMLDQPTTATAECGLLLKPTQLTAALLPTPNMSSPPHSPDTAWSKADPPSNLDSSPTVASPDSHPVTSPASVKVNPSNWASPHIVSNPNRLPVLLESPNP